MKELSKKVIESGLIEKHVVKMMEDWGYMDQGAADLVGKKKLTQENLEQFLEDIEALVSPDKPMQETRLEVQAQNSFNLSTEDGRVFTAVEDDMGKFIVPPHVSPYPGQRLLRDGRFFFGVVHLSTPLYQDEKLVAFEITIHRTKGG